MTVRIVEEAILHIYYSGPLDGRVLETGLTQIRALCTCGRVKATLSDAMAITAIHASVHEPARELLRFMKDHGIRDHVAASSWAPVRMLGTAIGLAVGIRIQFVSTPEEAWRIAQSVAGYRSHLRDATQADPR